MLGGIELPEISIILIIVIILFLTPQLEKAMDKVKKKFLDP
jgi:hypothetical protein